MNEAGADESARDVFRLDNDTLAFRFTATLTNRNGSRFERLTSPHRLELWLRANDLTNTAARATADDLRDAQDLRESIHRIGIAVCENRQASRADVAIVNTASELGSAHLVLQNGRALWTSTGDNPVRDALSIVAADAIAVLGGHDRDRVKACQGDGCTGLYVDTSRGNNRRWCSMNICGNKAKKSAMTARAD
ncbi:CGNR zinc finger domain-containing protein [Rhodococcus sp. NPDC060176]|uniref:CGNR zinc finger domain-containing protein n=1 Tax=Rhodococcus sp. NPDC060176 TaxID=3347062 RepID=UPI003655EA93